MPRPNEDRDVRIVAERDAGETLQSIGERYGITRERVRQICASYAERGDAMWSAANMAARRLGVDSNSATRAYRVMTGEHTIPRRYGSDELVTMRFEDIPPERWHEIPNCGDKALAVIGEVVASAMPE